MYNSGVYPGICLLTVSNSGVYPGIYHRVYLRVDTPIPQGVPQGGYLPIYTRVCTPGIHHPVYTPSYHPGYTYHRTYPVTCTSVLRWWGRDDALGSTLRLVMLRETMRRIEPSPSLRNETLLRRVLLLLPESYRMKDRIATG